MATDAQNARYLRIAVITNVYKGGYMTKEDALELLKGRLAPDDPESTVDDSDLLDKTLAEVQIAIFGEVLP